MHSNCKFFKKCATAIRFYFLLCTAFQLVSEHNKSTVTIFVADNGKVGIALLVFHYVMGVAIKSSEDKTIKGNEVTNLVATCKQSLKFKPVTLGFTGGGVGIHSRQGQAAARLLRKP